jgi:TetR/AcrR family transcriptional repressor of mexJK operon
LALGIMRPEVVALRRLLIGEAREFPAFGATYFERAPGQVLDALASGFGRWGKRGLLHVSGAAAARLAAAQFAYLVVGEPLDRAMLIGTVPSKDHVIDCAREGVETFLARYGAAGAGRAGRVGREGRAERDTGAGRRSSVGRTP